MHQFPSFSWAVPVLAAVVACGGGNTDGSGGSGGAGATGGSGATGAVGGNTSGGAGGTNASGTNAGGVAPGAGAPSGGGGSSSVGGNSVLDPSIPAPSYDCVGDVVTKACVAIRGTFNGQEVDKHCARPTSPLLLLKNPDAWPAACDEQAGQPKTGWFYQIAIPVHESGPFEYELVAGDDYIGADVVVVLDSFGADFRASNLTSGAVAGVVEKNAAGEHIVYGTFRATYGMPDILCNSSFATECAAGKVTGTFRVQSPLGGK
jgi:hypothetical protein